MGAVPPPPVEVGASQKPLHPARSAVMTSPSAAQRTLFIVIPRTCPSRGSFVKAEVETLLLEGYRLVVGFVSLPASTRAHGAVPKAIVSG